MALLISLALWWALAAAPVTEIAFEVPVEFHNVPEGVEVTTDSAPMAQVRVRGGDGAVRQLAPAELHLSLDLSSLEGAKAGERTFELEPSRLRLGTGIEVVQIVPATLRVSFDQRATRMVEVRPRVVGSFPPGMGIGEVKADPPQVEVVGPKAHVDATDSVTTDPIDASGVMKKQTFVARVHATDTLVRVTRSEAVRVTVTAERKR